MSETIVGALIGVGGTILGTIVGALIGYKYALWLVKETEFIKACAEFKIAFSDIIHWLNYDAVGDSIRTPGKLKEFHKRHIDAIHRFNAVFPEKKRNDFNISCEKFYNKKDNQYYLGYANLDSTPQREESRKLALDNINDLLHFSDSHK